jgi:hypothetical protein
MALPNFSPASQMSKVILPPTGNVANVTVTSLPFGVYVSTNYWTNEQISSYKSGSVEEVAFVYKKLGGDVVDIELVETQVHAAYEEACLEYSYLINLHQAKNALPFILGQDTGSFNNDGQLTGSNSGSLLNANLAFPKMQFVYAKNIGMAVNTLVGLNGNEPIYSSSFNMVPGQQDYDLQAAASASALSGGWDLNDKRINIQKVYYKTAGASWNFYGYFGGLNVVGNLSTYGQYADDSTFEIIPAWQNKLQAMAYEDAIKTRVSDWSFQIRNNMLRIFPVPNASSPEKFWFDFTVSSNAWEQTPQTVGISGSTAPAESGINGINNMNTIPFQNLPYDKINSIGKQWIRRFALALCKEMLGQIRSKWDKIPIPGDSVVLNGDKLISEGKEEQDKLREELKTQLADMTYVKLGEDSAKTMEDASKTQAYVPNLIFVG